MKTANISEQNHTSKTPFLKRTAHEEWRELFDVLPGGELIREGLVDVDLRKRTVPALLVQIGSPRLQALGLNVPALDANPEHALYDLLAEEDSDSAHSRYNAFIRTLVSFERAAECVAK